MSHAVKVETEIKDKELAKRAAKKLGFTVTEGKDGSLSLDIKSRYHVPFVIHANGTSSFDKAYDCQTAGNAIQKFVTEYTTEATLQALRQKGLVARRGGFKVDSHGIYLQTVKVVGV